LAQSIGLENLYSAITSLGSTFTVLRSPNTIHQIPKMNDATNTLLSQIDNFAQNSVQGAGITSTNL
jgi:hypothetical protein